jgi:hypothetical protein
VGHSARMKSLTPVEDSIALPPPTQLIRCF